MEILLKAATIVSPENKDIHLKKRDIAIRDGKIHKLAASLEAERDAQVLRFPNLHVSLGWFDSSVAFGEPGHEERETLERGLFTAARSGFTDILLSPNTHPLPDSSSHIVFLRKRGRAPGVRSYPMGTLTKCSQGLELAELYDMKNAGAVAFYDFKRSLANPNLLKLGLLYAQNFDGLLLSFPQDGDLKGQGVAHEGEMSTSLGLKGIPALAEELQLARDLSILEYTGGKLHIPTLSTARSVALVAGAKKKGLDVSCSVAIHNLMFTDRELEGFDTHFKVSPPLRGKADTKALIKGLKEGTIDFVTSDHLPIDLENKRVEFDNALDGTLGLESAFGALNKLLGLDLSIALLTRGRSRFGLEEPGWKVGDVANLTLFDPAPAHTLGEGDLLSTSKNSMFLGRELLGKVYGTILHKDSALSPIYETKG